MYTNLFQYIYHFKIDLSYFFQNSYRTISPRLKYLRINKFNSDPKNKLIFAPIQNVGRRGIGGKQGHRTWPAVNIVSNRRIKHSSGVRWKNRLPFPRVGRGGTITAVLHLRESIHGYVTDKWSAGTRSRCISLGEERENRVGIGTVVLYTIVSIIQKYPATREGFVLGRAYGSRERGSCIFQKGDISKGSRVMSTGKEGRRETFRLKAGRNVG